MNTAKRTSPQGKPKFSICIRALSVRLKYALIMGIADAVIDEFGEINTMYQDASHFTIRAYIALSPTFYAWVASLGKRAKILEPKEAVEGMKKFLQKASEMYEDEEKRRKMLPDVWRCFRMCEDERRQAKILGY